MCMRRPILYFYANINYSKSVSIIVDMNINIHHIIIFYVHLESFRYLVIKLYPMYWARPGPWTALGLAGG